MIFQGIMKDSRAVVDIRTELMTYRIPILLVVVIIPFLSGLITGIGIGFVGTSFPLIIPLFPPTPLFNFLSYAALAYVFGFMGMMLSPVHLCFLVTKDYFKAGLLDSYRSILKPLLTGPDSRRGFLFDLQDVLVLRSKFIQKVFICLTILYPLSQVGRVVSTLTVYYWKTNRPNPSLNHIPKVIKFLGYGPDKATKGSLGGRIIRTRRALGITQKELAPKLGVDPTTPGYWERGERKPIMGLCERFKVLLVSLNPSALTTG